MSKGPVILALIAATVCAWAGALPPKQPARHPALPYLPKVGPAPLRWHVPRVSPDGRYVMLPLDMGKLDDALHLAEAGKTNSLTNVVAASLTNVTRDAIRPGPELATNFVSAASPEPIAGNVAPAEAEEGEGSKVNLQMFLRFFKTNQPVETVVTAPVTVNPPVRSPSSSAVYTTK